MSELPRSPPHSLEAEQSLLGGLLLNNEAYDDVADIVAEGDFYRDGHRRIWRHIARLIDAGRAADLVTVQESIEASEDKDKTEGVAYLAGLAQNTPSALNIRRYAELVRDKAILRELAQRGQEIVEAALSAQGDPRELAEQAEDRVLSVLDREHSDEIDFVRLMMATADAADQARHDGPRALRTGYGDLDAKLGGLAPGSLTVLAARPSMGKTALALNIAEQVSARGAVAFFSLEMAREELAQRLLASATSISLEAIRSGHLDDDQVNALARHATSAGQRRLLLDDAPAVRLGRVRARCRRWKRRLGLALVIVDYLQLMRGEGDNREQEVASLSRGLKALAKELRVPIIALCQLNRALEGRMDKRPHLHDLRESGAIEQDADLVVMLYRDDLHGEESANRGLAQVLVRKHRQGPLGDVTLRYRPEFCRFESTEERFSVGPVRPVGGFRATRPDVD